MEQKVIFEGCFRSACKRSLLVRVFFGWKCSCCPASLPEFKNVPVFLRYGKLMWFQKQGIQFLLFQFDCQGEKTHLFALLFCWNGYQHIGGRGFPGGARDIKKLPACQCRRHGFDPWVGKIHWRRKWQTTPVFLPGKFHGQSSLVGYSPWGHKTDMTSMVSNEDWKWHPLGTGERRGGPWQNGHS